MPKIFGKSYTKDEIRRKTGNISQVGGIGEFTYNSGRAEGVKAIDVDAGDLKFTIFPSRCLDIGKATYKGYPFGYISKSGLRAASYFQEKSAIGFLDSFYGGLLITSGLNNIGVDCEIEGREYGVHGEIANIPAEQVSVRQEWKGDELVFSISGIVRHSRFYAEDLVMTREIKTHLGASTLTITDTIENRDYARVPLLFLYHFNFGFPFLDSSAKLLIPHREKTWARTPSAEKGLDSFDSFIEPVDGIEEECFYHRFNSEDGRAAVCLFNPALGENGMGVYVRYDTEQLPVFLQWKMMRSREYVCGFCPATTYLEGRKNALEKDEVMYIEPQEQKQFQVEIGITEDADSFLE